MTETINVQLVLWFILIYTVTRSPFVVYISFLC